MLKLSEIEAVVDRAATASLNGKKLSKVQSELATDSGGQDALLVTLVVKPEDEQSLDGDAALKIIVRIQHDLRAAGEERFAIVDFGTEGDTN